MDSDLIILDDELHLLADIAQQEQLRQQQLNFANSPGPSSVRTRRPRAAAAAQQRQLPVVSEQRGVKRTRNGTKVLPHKAVIPQADPQPSSSVIVDGQDIYYIQEVNDECSDAAEEIPYLDPNAILSYVSDDGTDTDEVVQMPEERPLTDEEEYYNVEPLELSDIWNDLITANQEILILLELSDLKDHIVDARRIEEQIKDMACDYCSYVFPDIKTLDKHIKKIHFLTEQFECDSCDGKFRHFARYRDHLNGHMGQRVYQCDECNHQYAFRMGFLVHKILDHMKLNGVYVCPKCDLDCRDAQHYKLHIASHIEFGPSSMPAQLPAAQPVSSTPAVAAAAKPSNGTVRKPTGYAKENERTKFLNVFESFSKNRNVEKSIPSATVSFNKFQI